MQLHGNAKTNPYRAHCRSSRARWWRRVFGRTGRLVSATSTPGGPTRPGPTARRSGSSTPSWSAGLMPVAIETPLGGPAPSSPGSMATITTDPMLASATVRRSPESGRAV